MLRKRLMIMPALKVQDLIKRINNVLDELEQVKVSIAVNKKTKELKKETK